MSDNPFKKHSIDALQERIGKLFEDILREDLPSDAKVIASIRAAVYDSDFFGDRHTVDLKVRVTQSIPYKRLTASQAAPDTPNESSS